MDRTREKWETHWNSALSDNMLYWLAHTACSTTIRLPVGYFTLGAEFCVGTPFAPDVAKVYVNAWAAVKKLVGRCLEYGIGVLLDFHALPGGANGEAHSGTGSGEAELWKSRADLEMAVRCLCFMAKEISDGGMDGVVGVQVCNEAQWEALGLYKFYDMVISKMAEADPTLPIYISDAWNLDTAIRYAIGKNGVKGRLSNPVIVDTHRYYTFAEKDISRSPQEIIAQIPRELSEMAALQENVFEKKGRCALRS
jgi:aryl-phospho-beta-D-glucosidase BglC (GH1 family)